MTAPFLFVPTFSWPATPGGLLYTYAAGGVTPLATYSDAAGSIPNTNPVVLDANGSATIRLSNSAYHFVLMDPTGSSTVWDQDQYVPEYLTLSAITTLLNPQTAAESAAFVNPSNLGYLEGDIRRYGALTTATDNSGAINAALLVSSNGGSAAYIPPGTWNYTNPVYTGSATYGASSLYGAGLSSVLAPAAGIDGLTFVPDPVATHSSRFFRDFAIIGPSTTVSTANGITHNLASGINLGIQFSNITIKNFAKAVDVEGANGLWTSSFNDCYLYNNYQGYYFNGQVILPKICGGFVQSGAMTGSGTRYGVFTNNNGGNVQSLHLSSLGIYQYDINVSLNLVVFATITDCDLSLYNVIGIQISSSQAGIFVRGNWIQANPSVAAVLTGISIPNNSAALNDKVVISGNNIIGNGFNGSVGIYCGTNWQSVSILDNTIGSITSPFTYGISGPGNPGANCSGMIVRGNTFYATAFAITLYVNCSGATIGPNVIQNGVPISFTGGTPVQLTYTHPQTPMTGAVTFAAATSQTITFATNLPFAAYSINVTPVASTSPPAWWISGVSASGFTINTASSFTGSFYWTIRVG